MAAYGALVSLMHLVHDLEHHPSPPISLDKRLLDSLTQHVAFFDEFLQSYKSPLPPVADDDKEEQEEQEEEEEASDPLEMRIAVAAHSAEDAIESHIVDSIEQQGRHYAGTKKANDEKIKSINLCHDRLQGVIEEMNSIKKVLLIMAEVVDTHKTNVVRVVVAPSETTLVGSDGVLLEIMEKLVGGQLDCQVIPIMGMGGIGKTFLAKTIYTKPFIKERFDICAWATISQHYDTREILCELLSQATNTKKEHLSEKSVDELGLELHNHLFCRRFLIVMDDMWSIDSWDKIQRFFPNNCNGSRALVTTRLSQLSLQLNNDYSLHMSFLDKASSWDLFSKTVFGEKDRCPSELEGIGEMIVENCRGLPLSIAVVGGLLKKIDHTRASWDYVRNNFTSVVNTDNDKHCLRLLKMSYNHLPVYLKPCFLYMGVFEEDEEIRVSTLVQLWVSEGFLRPTNGEPLETTARGFIQDLIDRNLIIIGELGPTGSLRFCRMHDLVRDMCLKEGRKEGFYHVIGHRDPHRWLYEAFGQLDPPPPSPPRGMNTVRRILMAKYTTKMKDSSDLRFMSNARSIICEKGKVSLSRNLVLLRTLDARKSTVSPLFCYVNLRHIAITTPMARPFLPFVRDLWNLRTLIVSYSYWGSPTLFAIFWTMQQLRHVEFTNSCACLPDPPNFGGAIMEHLHTLKGIRNLKCSDEVVKRVPNIKRLKLKYNSYDEEDDDAYFVGNLKNLCELEFLSVTFLPTGPIAPLQDIMFPHSLKKLSLCIEFAFEWNEMLERIGSLPLVESLKLSGGCFGEGKWEIGEGQFPCLKYLMVKGCWFLEKWTALEEDSSILPRLENLNLCDLEELKEISCEIGNIDTLKSVKLRNCGEGAVKSAKEMFDEQVDLQGGEDQLSFHVEVYVREEQQQLLSLAGPKFYVNLL